MRSRAGCAVLLAVLAGCAGGDSKPLQESLADVDPNGGMWALRSTCDAGSFSVDFRPGERFEASGLGWASHDSIGVNCGDAERIAIGPEDGAPAAVDMTKTTYAETTLQCTADGVLLVSVNPIWGDRSIVGSSLHLRQGGQAVLAGSLKRDEYTGEDWSRVAWSPALCRPD